MIGALIDDLARGVDVLDFGDRDDRRLALRQNMPAWTAATSRGGNQNKAE
jgi:hypothetical protein